MSVLILVPALARPHRVKPLLTSVAQTCPSGTRALFILDPDDEAEIAAVDAAAETFGRLVERILVDGVYPRKINAALQHEDAPLVFLGADDLEFRPGWFEAATAKLAEADVVGVNDLLERKRDHQTHFLVTRDYINRGQIDGAPGLLHEGYPHWFVDDEFIAVARKRGTYAYAPDAHVAHLHPMNGKAPMDATYQRGFTTRKRARRVFLSREHLWA